MDRRYPPPPPTMSRRVPTGWWLGLAVVLLVSLMTRELAGPLILGGLYLVATSGWALLRRGASIAVVGRRVLSGMLGLGVVALLVGGALAGPSRPSTAAPDTGPSTYPHAVVSPEPTATAQQPPATATPPASPRPTSTPQAPAVPTPDVLAEPTPAADGSALATALELEVKGRAPRTGYDRDLFGSGWVDVDRNGCDTRNDILARDLVDVTYRPGTRDCVVVAGTLHDPYSGQTIDFLRGNDTSSAVQIDHVVALSDAWQKGAQQWDSDKRVQFGNDPLNLLAVDGPLNMQKGDGDTATWLPPNRSYRCAYVARQVAVKHSYGVWVTAAEQDAMVRVLTDCPDEPLPTGGHSDVPTGTNLEPLAEVGPAATAPPASPEVYYPNCTAAREAGAAPVHRGEPGYGTHLDRDRDGIGCE